MRFTLLMVCCLFCLASFGQTKLISFKSHSGNSRNFRTTVEKDLFDIGRSNFGIVERNINRIDTVVKKNNKLIVFKSETKEVNGRVWRTAFKKDTLSLSKTFLEIKSIDSLKNALKKKYVGYLVNNLQFIDLDKENKLNKK